LRVPWRPRRRPRPAPPSLARGAAALDQLDSIRVELAGLDPEVAREFRIVAADRAGIRVFRRGTPKGAGGRESQLGLELVPAGEQPSARPCLSVPSPVPRELAQRSRFAPKEALTRRYVGHGQQRRWHSGSHPAYCEGGSRQRSAIGGTVAGVRVLVVGAVVLLLVSCGRTEPEPSRESSPDAKQLLVRLSDLPPQFTLVAGELLRPTTLKSVLAQPWSAGLEAEIARERISGFNTSVWSPEGRRIQCSLAVYRSSTGARQILEHSNSRFRAFLAARHLGRPIPVRALGMEASVFRFDLGRLKGLTIGWRHRSILATCSILGRNPPAFAELIEVVLAQHRRLATTLG
jgi:hypothetical protein